MFLVSEVDYCSADLPQQRAEDDQLGCCPHQDWSINPGRVTDPQVLYVYQVLSNYVDDEHRGHQGADKAETNHNGQVKDAPDVILGQ